MLTERFWNKVNKTSADGCWLWTACVQNKGYGEFLFRDENGVNAKRLAHRVSYMAHHGPIPKGLFILHKCDTPRCVNPAHLYAGNQLQNVADMMSRNRHSPPPMQSFEGAKNPKAKLTDEIVLRIRAEMNSGKSAGAVARELQMDKSTICDIRNFKTWKHLAPHGHETR